ncbi:hypothetical protein DES53_107186 [Roseimicrobium gellanilyticum]|uniref:Uncharacterized protein n=1 Tax=Roseimicrobium gellanilyticum TaxID=748857 RepID=A0A366HHP3_9BACT|nr:hypothetical protein [Roseimicrobium gellanilyticum]RBP41355.1 hypothetical protein DES53_107186 [Roseimicrobium gellanilyticum]
MSAPTISFLVAEEHLEDGLWNPKDSAEAPAGLQINLIGNRAHYLKLAEFIKKFAEQDTSNDSEYHEHFNGMMSVDGRTRLHIILRKDDVGDGSYSTSFPKSRK